MNQIIEYMNNSYCHYKGKRIYITSDDISLIQLQIILCKLLNECYIFTNIKQDINTCFQLYKKNLFGFVKQNKNYIYIWKIK